MRGKKSKQELTTDNWLAEQFPDLNELFLLNIMSLLSWKADKLYDLSLRTSELVSALNRKFGDFPSYEESLRFYSKLDKSIKNNFIDLAIRGCDQFQIISEEEFKKIAKTGHIDINLTNLKKSFEFARVVAKIKVSDEQSLILLGAACSVVRLLYILNKEPMQDDVLKSFIAIEHLLTSKLHEAIGYWTLILKGKKEGKIAGEKSGVIRSEKAKPYHEVWQKEAEKIWNKHPLWGKLEVAKRIAEHVGGNPGTIRKSIIKPTP